MDLNEIVNGLRGEGGVIFGLIFLFILFFRGGIVTGKAYESTVAAYEERLEVEREEKKFWRDKAIEVREEALDEKNA